MACRFGHIDQRVSQKQIIFCTSMVFFSGFLRYDNELVKTGEEKGSSDVRPSVHVFVHLLATDECHLAYPGENAFVSTSIEHGQSQPGQVGHTQVDN